MNKIKNTLLHVDEISLAEGFLKSAERFPDNHAIHIKGEYYTYRKLYELVLEIYSYLNKLDETYERIGIYTSDDPETYASILAVNIYGAAYVPLNSKFPISRNTSILQQANVKLVLNTVDSEFEQQMPDVKFISLLNIRNTFSKKEVFSLKSLVKQPLAYILYTSGTSGEPKGVPVSKKNVAAFFSHFDQDFYDFNEKDRFLQVYELSFDVSVFSFYLPLKLGACCYVLDQSQIIYTQILNALKKHEITVLSMVPTLLYFMEPYLDELSFPDLRYSFFSGDKLSHRLCCKWSKSVTNAQIINYYGPTETTIVCTYYPWQESISALESVNDIVPLGKPFDGMDYVIVDSDEKSAADFQSGELCFSGSQVIDTYLNNKFSERFFIIKNNSEIKKYYKTGDLASVNANGNLIFYGRKDTQVKINGYRIEMIEIEAALKKITDSLFYLMLHVDEKGLNRLVLFVEKKSFLEIDIKKKLAENLPAYMLPSKIIMVDRLPLNENNKVDSKLLLTFLK